LVGNVEMKLKPNKNMERPHIKNTAKMVNR